MKKRIYLSLLAMGLACMAIIIVIYSGMFWKSTQEQAQSDLASAAKLISTGLARDPDPQAYLRSVADKTKGDLRVTWIDTDGSIKFESDYDKGQMENHLERPEVKKAFTTGNGQAVRQSSTISREYYYAAEKLPDGTIIRLSEERDNIFSHFLSLLPFAAIIFLIAGIACIKASRMLAANLLDPLRKTARLMENIGTPGREVPLSMPKVYSELRPMVQKILDQSVYIDETIQTLERERNTIRLMLENLEEGVILTDVRRRIVLLNRRARDIMQLRDNREVSGLMLDKLLPEADWNIAAAPETPELVQKLTRNDRLYRMTAQAIYKQDELYGALFILYDNTEVEQREQLRREFTSNVSHELKTPLTSISGFAEMMAAGLYEEKKDVVHFSTLIRQESQRLLTLIDSIIHLTRIEEAPGGTDFQDVHLKKIIEDLADFIKPVTQEKKVTLHLDLDDCVVHGNSGLLRELAMNLMDNAVKYNHPGGHVYVTLKPIGMKCQLRVKDTGIGIPEDKQQRVFERFYRVDASRSKKNGGTGLGLSIVKHIVEQHHGTIALKSRENEGTEITVVM